MVLALLSSLACTLVSVTVVAQALRLLARAPPSVWLLVEVKVVQVLLVLLVLLTAQVRLLALLVLIRGVRSLTVPMVVVFSARLVVVPMQVSRIFSINQYGSY